MTTNRRLDQPTCFSFDYDNKYEDLICYGLMVYVYSRYTVYIYFFHYHMVFLVST